MSVLNKKPFINTVLEGLSEADQVKLNNLLNGQGDRTQLQRILGLASGMRTPITEADKGVHLCSLQIGPNAYDGYLLYTDDKCCLVWFTDFQTLSMFDIDVAKQKFAVVSEYLDITELRSSLNILLVEAGHAVKIQADDVDSGVATEGQVLVADGNGGAIWGEAAGGSSTPYIDLTAGTKTVDDVMAELGLTKTWGYYPNYINIVKVKKTYTGSTKENLMLLTFESNSHKLSIIQILNFNDSGEKFEAFYWEGLNSVIPSDLANSPTVYVSKTLGGGTQLYKHHLSLNISNGIGTVSRTFILITTNSTAIDLSATNQIPESDFVSCTFSKTSFPSDGECVIYAEYSQSASVGFYKIAGYKLSDGSNITTNISSCTDTVTTL